MVMYYGIYHNDVASGSEIRHAIKLINHKWFSALQLFWKRYYVHNNVAYIITQL